MAVRFQLRRDTAANWASANSVLALGEPGVETDTLKVKVGDGYCLEQPCLQHYQRLYRVNQ